LQDIKIKVFLRIILFSPIVIISGLLHDQICSSVFDTYSVADSYVKLPRKDKAITKRNEVSRYEFVRGIEIIVT